MPDYLDNFKAYADSSPEKESCGVVCNGKFIKCTNISEDPDNFIIDPIDLINLEKIEFVCHSHLGYSAKPSTADVYSCNNGKVPWIIYSIKSKDVFYLAPNQLTVPLIGREYSFGTTDCYGLIQDVLKIEKGIIVGRPIIQEEYWFSKNRPNLFEEYAEVNGFYKIDPKESLNKYDVILFSFNKNEVPDHSGIKYDGNTFLHHLVNRLSTLEVFTGYWNKTTTAVYRHKEI